MSSPPKNAFDSMRATGAKLGDPKYLVAAESNKGGGARGKKGAGGGEDAMGPRRAPESGTSLADAMAGDEKKKQEEEAKRLQEEAERKRQADEAERREMEETERLVRVQECADAC